MSVLDKAGRVEMVDDTIPLTCAIEAAHNVQGHTEYIIRVQRGPEAENSWQVARRYTDFVAMDSSLSMSGILPTLPPKKVFGNMDREFIAERQLSLQNYLNGILMDLKLASSIHVKKFLDDRNYSTDFQELAKQHVSMHFRSEQNWEISEPLAEIGWRIRKHYFMIALAEKPKDKQVLFWSDFGVDKTVADKEAISIIKTLPSIQHGHIRPVTFSSANSSGAITVGQWNDSGTLKDLICKSKPKQAFLRKYCKPKNVTPIPTENIRRYGRQILETLQFLQERNWPYCHLHAGNVIVDEASNTCQLLDVENWLLGLPSYYKPYFTQLKKIQTTEAIEVYCFGHFLYEMAFGEGLQQPKCDKDSLPPDCHPEIKSAILGILSPESCKKGMPSLADILAFPLFSDVSLNPAMEKPVFKISSKVKESLKVGKELYEKRLRKQQKVLNHHRRVTKAQAYHMSDEEKKKRRKEMRKNMSLEQQPSKILPDEKQTTATTTVTSSAKLSVVGGAVPSPPPPPPPPSAAGAPPPPPPPQTSPPPATSAMSPPPSSGGRQALLGSIQGFSKGGLKKCETIDKSAPKI